MDENLFFKQATLLICSSLDIEVALWRFRQFIAEHMPADEIYLNIYEPAIGGLRYIARANADGGEKMEMSVRLPEELIHAIESGRRLKDHLVINRPGADPMGRIIQSAFNLSEVSFIAQRLIIEGHRLGVIDLFARGYDRFTEDHAKRLAPLREPFAIAMANALKHQEVVELKERLASDNRYLSSALISQSGDEVIGAEAGLKPVMEKVKQIAQLKNTILIMGETGVGKEVIANAIHRLSPRGNEPIIKVNCGAIPENLIDSELFGHERGAFTGAVKQKRGLFERSHRGTIFLDEIGELPPWAQIRLLRVLQTQEIERVGGSPPIKLDIRVIAATHRDLKAMVDNGTFREDLWFRINAFPIQIPPLRHRPGDIALLVTHFLKKKSKELGMARPPKVANGAMERLAGHSWPGNVRELENMVERALIQHRHGPLHFHRILEKEAEQPPTLSLDDNVEEMALDDVMRRHIELVLGISKGRVNGPGGAADILKIHPNTLRKRMQKLGIAYGRRRRTQAPVQ
ncbi:MAG: sigma 54-interacting transcriptional regulator [Desulfobacteraceae bacterium]|jgi:transcriptional regulator with GAF, ATPase, and Fis domain